MHRRLFTFSVDCDDPVRPEFGNPPQTPEGTLQGSRATYTCQEGLEFCSKLEQDCLNPDELVQICLSTGQWDPQPVVCQSM